MAEPKVVSVLHLHRSERADALVEPLADLLTVPPPDPFTADVVAVPTRGVERWLAQRLSHHLGAGVEGERNGEGEAGVCAGVSFDSPARLAAAVLARVLRLEPQDDPWRGERLLWSVLQVVDECAGEPWCAALGHHLGLGSHPGQCSSSAAADEVHRLGRRLGVSRHLAELFTSYGVQRPAMLRRWADDLDDDGVGAPVPPDLAWQRRLWRTLRERIGVPSPAERLEDAVRAVVADPGRVDLPQRLSVFGATRLPEEQLAVLHGLSRHREVHLWLPHPSPALWQAVAKRAAGSPRRGERERVAAHPMLASMARDATELQVRLRALDGVLVFHHRASQAPAGTLLGALQRSLRRDEPAGELLVREGDRSIEVHACHGRARQVEVLRDVLVGLFAQSPTLQPRDVVVMCPDVEAFAPLVGAVFGLAGEQRAGGAPDKDVHPGQRLRVRLADRSLRQTNPQLSLLAALLDLADGRVTASEVLDLAATEPVRRRFRFDDAELDRLRAWAVASGVHWGENAGRRARFGLGDVRQGTWEVALDRVLLGAAMAEEGQRYVAWALPLDDVDSTEIDLAGRLAEFLDRLGLVLAGLSGAQPVAAWLDALERALELLADAAPQDAWQGVQARQVLADVRAGGGSADALLRLADVRVLLTGHLRGRPTRAGFRTGALTVCSLEPMRAVPHRVVCLLGLDDGTFPRLGSADGDDVLLRDPCLGERDRRSEDRQLFLDAVTAAGEHLVVVYSGADERTGAARPPAVPVAELLDALDQVAAGTFDGRPVREKVVVHHPLQNVDERAFTPGALNRAGPFSFDALACAAAVAGRHRRGGRRPFLDEPLTAAPASDLVDLDDLVAMLEHPVRWFLRTRLGLWLPDDPDDVEDRMPLVADGLASWGVGDRVLEAVLGGADVMTACQAEWRRGSLPPQQLGGAQLEKIRKNVQPLVAETGRYALGPAQAVDVAVHLSLGGLSGGGLAGGEVSGQCTLTGTVTGVHAGPTLVRSVYSRLAAKHRLRAWVQLLALAAAGPQEQWTAVTIGREAGSRPAARVVKLAAPPPDEARRRLDELLDLRRRASRQPLPLPVKCAAAYAGERLGHGPADLAYAGAEREWRGGDRYPGERAEPAHVEAWGECAQLTAIAGEPDEVERSWDWPVRLPAGARDRPEPGETRLGVLAMRVWAPLLEREERL